MCGSTLRRHCDTLPRFGLHVSSLLWQPRSGGVSRLCTQYSRTMGQHATNSPMSPTAKRILAGLGSLGAVYLILTSFTSIPTSAFYRSAGRALVFVCLAGFAFWLRPASRELHGPVLRTLRCVVWLAAALALAWFIGALVVGGPVFRVVTNTDSVRIGQTVTLTVTEVDSTAGIEGVSFTAEHGLGILTTSTEGTSASYQPMRIGEHRVTVVVRTFPWLEQDSRTITVNANA